MKPSASNVLSKRKTVERGRFKRRASSGAPRARLSRPNSPSRRRPRSRAGTMYFSVPSSASFTVLMALGSFTGRQRPLDEQGHGLGLFGWAGMASGDDGRIGGAQHLGP